jgi:hypothetical protein
MNNQVSQARAEIAERIIQHADRTIWCKFNNGKYFFTVWIEIRHDNHDIDYNEFTGFLNKYPIMKKRSCEYQSNLLYSYIVDKYPNRNIHIEISKDANTNCGTMFAYNTTKPMQSMTV